MTGIYRLLNHLGIQRRAIAFCAMGRDVEDIGLDGVERGQWR